MVESTVELSSQALVDQTEKLEENDKVLDGGWQKVIDTIADLVFLVDRDYRLLGVNKAFCRTLNKEPKELIGKRCFEVLHHTDKPWSNCPHKKTLITKKAATEEVNDPNLGLSLLISNSPIFDEKGKLVGAVDVA